MQGQPEWLHICCICKQPHSVIRKIQTVCGQIVTINWNMFYIFNFFACYGL